MSIEIHHVTKQFGHFRALDDISLDIDSGELLALLAVATLLIKSLVEWQFEREQKAAAALPPERPTAPVVA